MTTKEPLARTARGPYSKGVQRRQLILDRTLDVIADKGLDQTSLRAIGDAIGVTHAALKNYFASREALLVEVLRARDAESSAATQAIPGVFERMAAAANLNADVPGLVALHTSLLAASVEAGSVEAAAFFAQRFDDARRDVSNQLRAELADSGRQTDVDLETMASLIMAAFDGLQIQWLLDRRVDIAGTLRLLERILR